MRGAMHTLHVEPLVRVGDDVTKACCARQSFCETVVDMAGIRELAEGVSVRARCRHAVIARSMTIWVACQRCRITASDASVAGIS